MTQVADPVAGGVDGPGAFHVDDNEAVDATAEDGVESGLRPSNLLCHGENLEAEPVGGFGKHPGIGFDAVDVEDVADWRDCATAVQLDGGVDELGVHAGEPAQEHGFLLMSCGPRGG